jgi:hypothetical protein
VFFCVFPFSDSQLCIFVFHVVAVIVVFFVSLSYLSWKGWEEMAAMERERGY